jgi:hypothetical protein
MCERFLVDIDAELVTSYRSISRIRNSTSDHHFWRLPNFRPAVGVAYPFYWGLEGESELVISDRRRTPFSPCIRRCG